MVSESRKNISLVGKLVCSTALTCFAVVAAAFWTSRDPPKVEADCDWEQMLQGDLDLSEIDTTRIYRRNGFPSLKEGDFLLNSGSTRNPTFRHNKSLNEGPGRNTLTTTYHPSICIYIRDLPPFGDAEYAVVVDDSNTHKIKSTLVKAHPSVQVPDYDARNRFELDLTERERALIRQDMIVEYSRFWDAAGLGL